MIPDLRCCLPILLDSFSQPFFHSAQEWFPSLSGFHKSLSAFLILYSFLMTLFLTLPRKNYPSDGDWLIFQKIIRTNLPLVLPTLSPLPPDILRKFPSPLHLSSGLYLLPSDSYSLENLFFSRIIFTDFKYSPILHKWSFSLKINIGSIHSR